MKIDTSNWKEFRVGDLFDIHPTKAYKLNNAQLLNGGENPVVVNSAYNNGIGGYSTQDTTEKGNMVTFSDTVDANTIFYQPNDFIGYPHVQGLYPVQYEDKWNECTYSFFVSVFRGSAISKGFDYGNKFRRDIAVELMIKLPATSDGQPDWDYMESYMNTVMERAEKKLEMLKKADDTKHKIDVSKWEEFKVEDLFDKLTLKCRKTDFNKALDCSEVQTEEFSLPLTNAKHFNNGIQFYGRPNDWDSAEMTIDIVSNGAIATGDVYAQPQRTGVLWDSYLIKCKHDIKSELVLQYMACVIQRCIKQHFGWDDKCTWNKVREKTIKLPVTECYEPDWAYMESYMKDIMQTAQTNIDLLSDVIAEAV